MHQSAVALLIRGLPFNKKRCKLSNLLIFILSFRNRPIEWQNIEYYWFDASLRTYRVHASQTAVA